LQHPLLREGSIGSTRSNNHDLDGVHVVLVPSPREEGMVSFWCNATQGVEGARVVEVALKQAVCRVFLPLALLLASVVPENGAGAAACPQAYKSRYHPTPEAQERDPIRFQVDQNFANA